MSAPLPVLSPSMHLAGGKDRKSGRGCGKVITAAEARLPEEEAAGRDRGALEARLERAERHVAKLQHKLLKQAQYSFSRFNALRAEFEFGQRLYQNARANAKEGVHTMEWPPSNNCKDLAGFGYDEMYEEVRNEGAMSGSADDDDGHNSQDTSGVWSNAGSVVSGASSTKSGSNRGFIASQPPQGKKRRKGEPKEPSPRNRDTDPSQGY